MKNNLEISPKEVWTRSPKDETSGWKVFLVTKYFGTVRVYLWVVVDVLGNSHVSLSSGSKRKFKYTFEAKGSKNLGTGLDLLIWVRTEILKFPESFTTLTQKQLRSMSVAGADSRLFRIYERGLTPYGFLKTRTKEYGLVLYKKFKNK